MLIGYLKDQQAFPEYVTKFHFRQVLDAVEHMHSEGIAHLDLKLENIMFDDFFNIRVGDFGSSYDYSDQFHQNEESMEVDSQSSESSGISSLSSQGSVTEDYTNSGPRCRSRRGTIAYMAPEVRNLQQGENYDPVKADIYSLGVCMFALLFKCFPQHTPTLNIIDETTLPF